MHRRTRHVFQYTIRFQLRGSYDGDFLLKPKPEIYARGFSVQPGTLRLFSQFF